MNRNRTKGFTLLELMITIGLVGVMFGLLIPNMRDFLRNNRLTSAANDLLRGSQQARSEAIKLQQGDVVMCASNNAEAADNAVQCSFGQFSGWIVFNDVNNNGQHDAGEAVVTRGVANSTVNVRNDNGGILCFMPTGFEDVNCGGRVKTQNIVLCDDRGITAQGTLSTARAVLITVTGRTRVTNVQAPILATGVACP
jgi:prepilin-type N-terminal cleavage/methylation domain-containing protein